MQDGDGKGHFEAPPQPCPKGRGKEKSRLVAGFLVYDKLTYRLIF
jgi:hypothetical protein